jgi:hypothetical protein
MGERGAGSGRETCGRGLVRGGETRAQPEFLREVTNCAKLSPGVLRSRSIGLKFLLGAQRERTAD